METHAGLEPVIATVKGLCPNHLDEWAMLQREDSLQILCSYMIDDQNIINSHMQQSCENNHIIK